MAWRLNTPLHELKLNPGAALTTKDQLEAQDQLEALFRTEVERMSAEPSTRCLSDKDDLTVATVARTRARFALARHRWWNPPFRSLALSRTLCRTNVAIYLQNLIPNL